MRVGMVACVGCGGVCMRACVCVWGGGACVCPPCVIYTKEEYHFCDLTSIKLSFCIITTTWQYA